MNSYHCAVFTLVFLVGGLVLNAERPRRMTQKDWLELVIRETRPLKYPRAKRLPLYVWACRMQGINDEAEMERLIRELNERGIATLVRWGRATPKAIEYALKVGRIQEKLGIRVNVDATGAVYAFCDGSKETAHITADGKPFFDTSFATYRKMGCPFALEGRYKPMREKLEPFLKAYKENGIDLGFWAVDWEIDGPIEWNDAWASSKKCARCTRNIKDIDNFTAFQEALRRIRSEIQGEVFCKTIKKYFPNALIGNYGVYPHDGYRYWYDYYEKDVEGAPGISEQKAFYRKWAHEFDASGYTMAMPVVYSWFRIWEWYNFARTDYRWFYNMLMVATNAGKHTRKETPLVPFVHWSTTTPPKGGLPPGFVAMSETAYKELLWHMLLRGHDTFCMWCPRRELQVEIRPLHQVDAESLKYSDFLSNGRPVLFDLPREPGVVISAIKLGGKLLVRRTDFAGPAGPVAVKILGKTLRIPKADGRCQILDY